VKLRLVAAKNEPSAALPSPKPPPNRCSGLEP
jgi:hypothetical protein